jgi:hypothetical protein
MSDYKQTPEPQQPAASQSSESQRQGPSQLSYGQSPYGQPQYSANPSGRPQAPSYGQYGQRQYSQQGYPQQVYAQQQYPQRSSYYLPPEAKWNGLSIAGFVLSFFIYPLGLILSVIALVQINKSHEKSKGLAIAGTVLGAANTLFIIVAFLLVGSLSRLDWDTINPYLNCKIEGNCSYYDGDDDDYNYDYDGYDDDYGNNDYDDNDYGYDDAKDIGYREDAVSTWNVVDIQWGRAV